LHWAAQVECNALKRAASRRHGSVRDHSRSYARPAQSSPMSHVLDDSESGERRYAGPPGRTKLLLECARRPAPPPPPRFPGYTRLTISLQGPTLPTSLLHWRSSRQTGSLRTVCSSTRETLMSTLYAYGVQRDEHAVRVRGTARVQGAHQRLAGQAGLCHPSARAESARQCDVYGLALPL